MSKLVKFLGDAASAVTPGKTAVVKTKPNVSIDLADKKDLLAAGVGAGAGALVIKRHRVLGALLGMSLGSAVRSLTAGQKARAACDAGTGVVAYAAARHWKKHPALAWLGATLAGSVAASFVPGSREYELKHFSTGNGK